MELLRKGNSLSSFEDNNITNACRIYSCSEYTTCPVVCYIVSITGA